MDNTTALFDSSVECLHDFLTTIVQLKAQLRLAQAEIDERNRLLNEEFVPKSVVGNFNAQINELNEALALSVDQLDRAEAEAAANRQKASHIDTFVNQINGLNATQRELEAKNSECVQKILDLEYIVNEREATIKNLEKDLAKLTPKVVPLKKVDKGAAKKAAFITEIIDNSNMSKTTVIEDHKDDF